MLAFVTVEIDQDGSATAMRLFVVVAGARAKLAAVMRHRFDGPVPQNRRTAG